MRDVDLRSTLSVLWFFRLPNAYFRTSRQRVVPARVHSGAGGVT